MEHLVCLHPDDLAAFLIITEMQIQHISVDIVVAEGDSTFMYLYDYVKQKFCMLASIN